MSDPQRSITAEIGDLKKRQEELFTEARDQRVELLAELGKLCAYLGPLTREELPDGILKRRRRKATKPTAKPRKTKSEEAA